MNRRHWFLLTRFFLIIGLAFIWWGDAAFGADLPEIKEKGVLRHLGVPYANFVTGSGDGLDVELVKLFAAHLGVRYDYVKTSWENVIGDLSGKVVVPKGDAIEVKGDVPVKGDIIANGLTVLPWREKIVNYSNPTFPNQVWLIAKADSPLKPIKSTGSLEQDIAAVKRMLKGHQVLCKARTCLDPSLYGLQKLGAKVELFQGGLNDMASAIIRGEAELTILDAPDALIALEKWSGEIKVIGPISNIQMMGCAFAQTSPKLREAFNQFLAQCTKNGTYVNLVKKYYPTAFNYFPEFFKDFR